MIYSLRIKLIEAPDKYRVYINDNDTLETDLGGVIAILETEIKENDPEWRKLAEG